MMKRHVFRISITLWMMIALAHTALAADPASNDQNTATPAIKKDTTAPKSQSTKYILDTSASTVFWKGSKKIIGDPHDGTVKIKSGHIVFTDNSPQSAEIIVDMNTIENKDISRESLKKKLVDHLKNEDFFFVTKFPTSSLIATKFQSKATNSYQVTSNITVRGITKPLSFSAKLTKEGDVLKGTGEYTLDRTQFNVKYNSERFFPNLGDKIISDDIELKFEFTAKPEK